ncbi:MAG: aspartate--tRNA ligase, partial [Chloroflexi bacterium]|nr:aspartate--tRNA ligase [Chloroflexota bacterium]
MRADRQPEFTQLDLEMSFVDEEDILGLVEEMLISLVEAVKPSMRVIRPFPRLSFRSVMDRYGTDKPDIRFGLEFQDLSDVAAATSFAVFRNVLEKHGKVKGICVPGCAGYTRRQLEELTELAKVHGAKGLATLALRADTGDLAVDASGSFVAKFFTPAQISEIAGRFGAKAGDLLLIVADDTEVVNKALGQIRLEMGRRLGLVDSNLLGFFFVL